MKLGESSLCAFFNAKSRTLVFSAVLENLWAIGRRYPFASFHVKTAVNAYFTSAFLIAYMVLDIKSKCEAANCQEYLPRLLFCGRKRVMIS